MLWWSNIFSSIVITCLKTQETKIVSPTTQ